MEVITSKYGITSGASRQELGEANFKRQIKVLQMLLLCLSQTRQHFAQFCKICGRNNGKNQENTKYFLIHYVIEVHPFCIRVYRGLATGSGCGPFEKLPSARLSVAASLKYHANSVCMLCFYRILRHSPSAGSVSCRIPRCRGSHDSSNGLCNKLHEYAMPCGKG